MSARTVQFAPLGDSALTITLGDEIDEGTRQLVATAVARLVRDSPPGVTDLVPAFVSIALHYDPVIVGFDGDDSPFDRMVAALEHRLSDLRPESLPTPRVVVIPVCYGGELGPDLEEVAAHHGLTSSDVVDIHTSGDYVVYMVGFIPGFAYLGGLSDRIATPRRSSPRTAVPAGTVGIGGQQTGVYPLESPGGWNLIGRTPAQVFDVARDEPALLAAGDRVRFESIGRADYDQLLAGRR